MTQNSGALPVFQVDATGKPIWSPEWEAVFAERLQYLAGFWVVFEIHNGDRNGNRALEMVAQFELKLSPKGKLTEPFRSLFYAALRFCPDQLIILSIKKRRQQRSNPQNAYYHGVVKPIMTIYFVNEGWEGQDGEPWTESHTHKYLKEKFNFIIFTNPETDEKFKYVRSTADLNTEEFNVYLEKIAKFAAENGVVIPPPDPEYKKHRKNSKINQL